MRTTDFMTRINVPVSSRSSKQYMTSGSFPFALAAAIAAGGIVILGKEYIAPVQIEIHSLGEIPSSHLLQVKYHDRVAPNGTFGFLASHAFKGIECVRHFSCTSL